MEDQEPVADAVPADENGDHVCSWCRTLIKRGNPLSMITHGICRECAAIYYPKRRTVEVVH